MPSKISALTDGGVARPSDTMPVVRGGANFKARAKAALRVITDADNPVLLDGDLFVEYQRTDTADLEVFTPEEDNLVLIITNIDAGFALAPDSVAELFYDGDNGLVGVVDVQNNETIVLVSKGGFWVVVSRYTGYLFSNVININGVTAVSGTFTNSLNVGPNPQTIQEIGGIGNFELDFGSIAAGASADLTIPVTGATTLSAVSLGLPASPAAGIIFQAFVSAADVVTVRATNITASPVDPGAAGYTVVVFKVPTS